MKEQPSILSELLERTRQHTDELNAQKVTAQAEIAALQTKREELLDTPITREDMRAFIGKYVDLIASEYPDISGLNAQISKLARPVGNNYDVGSVNRDDPFMTMRLHDSVLSSPGRAHNAYGAFPPKLFWDKAGVMQNGEAGMLFFFGEAIKTKLLELFDATPVHPDEENYERAALEQRRQLIADIDADIEKLNARLVRINDQLEQLRSASTKATSGIEPGNAVKVPKVKRKHSFIPRGANDTSTYTEAEVLALTGFSAGQLSHAITHGGFPESTWREGLRFWPAARVDAWVMRNSEQD